jgi:hypothetical protein
MENQRDHFALRKQDNEFLRNRLNVTRDDYAKSVESLLRIAMDDTAVPRPQRRFCSASTTVTDIR